MPFRYSYRGNGDGGVEEWIDAIFLALFWIGDLAFNRGGGF